MSGKKSKKEPKIDKDQKKQVEEKIVEENTYEIAWDKYVRLQAEFDNYRKRSFKERAEFIKYANDGLILELIQILDNFELGIKSAETKKDYELLHQGVNMISKQLHSLLEQKGLSKIKSLGQKFDPHQHEALEVVESEDEDDIVIEEMQPGYTLNGRIVRPARVKVARKYKVSEGRETKDDNDKEGKKKEEVKEEIIEEEGGA